MFKDKQWERSYKQFTVSEMLNMRGESTREKKWVSRKIPNHEDSCVVYRKTGRSLEIYKLSSDKLKIFYVLVYAHIYICVLIYNHMQCQ